MLPLHKPQRRESTGRLGLRRIQHQRPASQQLSEQRNHHCDKKSITLPHRQKLTTIGAPVGQ